jgi:hypothetical protein
MKSTYENDWLHPSVEGYRALGEYVDLKLFTPLSVLKGL